MQQKFPEVSLPLTESRVMESTRTGDVFSISIGLPAGYYASEVTYPVLYILDAQWSFATVLETARTMAAWEAFPDLGRPFPAILVVGIGFPALDPQPYRRRHYVPAGWLEEPVEGGAGDFLSFIREDLIPRIESSYRVDPSDRGLMGDSLGGLFGLYAMLSRPATFKRFVVGSPWLVQETPAVFAHEQDFADTTADLEGRVFVGVGSEEPLRVRQNIQQLEEVLRSRRYPGFDLETHVFSGETHLSVLPYNLIRGLMAVYS